MEENRKVKIHVSHLKKSFGSLEVLKDINTDIYEGEVVVLEDGGDLALRLAFQIQADGLKVKDFRFREELVERLYAEEAGDGNALHLATGELARALVHVLAQASANTMPRRRLPKPSFDG